MIEIMSSEKTIDAEESFTIAWLKKYPDREIKPTTYRDHIIAIRLAGGYMHAYFREETARYVMASGVKAHFFGGNWDLIEPEDRGNSVFHGEVDYKDTAEICTKTKLLVSDNAYFHHSIHDRAETAMLNGAAVLSCHNGYLESILCGSGKEQNILFYDANHPESILETVRQSVDEPRNVEEIAVRGFEKAWQSFTWEKRAEEIRQIIFG